jgi:hypothetical protein
MKENAGTTIAGVAVRNYTIGMSTRWKVLLAVAGVLLLCFSCAALLYAVWPLSSLREQGVIRPELFRMP